MQLAHGAMLAGEDRPERLIEYQGDLLEREAADVAQVHDLAIVLIEPREGPFESGQILRIQRRTAGGRARRRESDQRLLLHRHRLPLAAAHLVAQPVHGDAEQPLFEPALFGIGADLVRDRAERRLRNLLRKIRVPALGMQKGEDAMGVGPDDLRPCGLVALRRPDEKCLDRRWLRFGGPARVVHGRECTGHRDHGRNHGGSAAVARRRAGPRTGLGSTIAGMFDAIARVAGALPAPVTFFLGVVVLLAGGGWLVDGADRLARRFGVSPLVIGLTVVAFGTSAPELAFNIVAAVAGSAELSFGNVIGSNIANIGLVLGLSALLCPIAISPQVRRIELPLLGLVTLLGVAVAAAPLSRLLPALGGGLDRPGWGRVEGVIFILVFAGFCLVWIRAARNSPTVGAHGHAPPTLPRAVLLIGAGLLLLMGGAKLTEVGAVGMADMLGMETGVIGLTIVAVSTSLPEIVTSAIAARRGQSDLAIGNVIGSNIFNLLLVLGVTTLIAPVPVPPGGVFDLAVMVGLTVSLLAITVFRLARIGRPAGVVLLLAYAVAMTWRILGSGEAP